MRVKLEPIGGTRSEIFEADVCHIPDASNVARLLAEESCTSLTIERWDGYSYRYTQAPEGGQ